MTYYVRDTTAYQEIYDSFDGVKHAFEAFTSYQPSEMAAPQRELESVEQTLDPDKAFEGAADSIQAAEDAVSDADPSDPDDDSSKAVDLLDSDMHSGVSYMGDMVGDWNGETAFAFKQMYVNRYPVYVVGQVGLARLLRETLRVAEKAHGGARESCHNVGLATVDALESGDADSDFDPDWETILTVGAAVASVAGSIVFAPPTFGGSFGVAAAVLAGGMSIGAHVAGADADEKAAEKPADIGGATVADVIGSMHSALREANADVDDVEQKLADAMNDVHGAISSGSDGRTIALPGGEKSLNVRESYFEFPVPGGAAEMAAGDVGAAEITGGDYMGGTGNQGKELGVDLRNMNTVAVSTLPGLAAEYAEAAGVAETADSGLESAFSRDRLSIENDSQGISSQGGALYPAWAQLHELFVDMLAGSGAHLDSAADALAHAVTMIADGDDEARAELESLLADE